MRIHRSYIALGLLIAFFLFFELAAHADVGNEQTKVKLNTPVQIPGRVLPAGNYRQQTVVADQATPGAKVIAD
jgi:hypothetical protein